MEFSKLKPRLITAAVLILIVATALVLSAVFSWGQWLLTGLAALCVILSSGEVASMYTKNLRAPASPESTTNRGWTLHWTICFSILVIPTLSVLFVLFQPGALGPLTFPSLWSLKVFMGGAGVAFLLLLIYITGQAKDSLDAIIPIQRTVLPAFLHVGICGGLLCYLCICQDPQLCLLWLIFVCAANDSAAYFVGSRLGGPKFAPIISPNKTVSGSIGGVSAAVVCGSLIAYFFELTPNIYSAGAASFLAAIAGQLGDLLKSIIKRQNNVKDSGTLLPGHGGRYDRLDAIFLTSPIALFLIQ